MDDSKFLFFPFISSKHTYFYSIAKGNSPISSNNLIPHSLAKTLMKVINNAISHDGTIYLLNSFINIMNLNLISSCIKHLTYIHYKNLQCYYVNLLHEKSQAINALEIYLNKVERWKFSSLIKMESTTKVMMKLKNTLVQLLNSFKNMVFVRNTQCHVHHNKMVYQKGVTEY